jgi:acyl-CoA synthetase (AMP-forming)/AMP-acid ligase II
MTEMNPRTIPQVVAHAARRFGGQPAIQDGDTTLSFEELADAGVRASRAFMASGVAAGDRVAIWSPNAWEWVVAAIGLQSAGAALVPLNTRLKGVEAGGILRASGAKLLCSVDGFLDTDYVGSLVGESLPDLQETILLRGERDGCTSWNDFLGRSREIEIEAARERAAAVSPEDLSDMLFTSGTTGAPKGVMTAHGQNIQVFETWSDGVGLREGDRYLVVMPFFHSFGYKAGWLACLLKGATCLPHPVFDARVVLERIAHELRHVVAAARRHGGGVDPGGAGGAHAGRARLRFRHHCLRADRDLRHGDDVRAGRRPRDDRDHLGQGDSGDRGALRRRPGAAGPCR